MTITPADFVKNWNDSTLREQQGAQLHFQQLVELVGLNPASYFGTTGDKAVFEQHVEKTGGGAGRADVSYQGRFAWEYKGKLKDLDSAYAQVLSYRSNLGNPPLLIVCDFLEYRIYPQWPNLSGQPIKIFNQDLLIYRNRKILRWALTDPDKTRHLLEKQRLDSEKLTEKLANKFAHLSDLMRQHPLGGTPKWGAMQIARFLTKLVFSLFVEDVGLLPPQYTAPMFRYLADGAINVPEAFAEHLKLVFSAMNGETNRYNVSYVPYFNGGIFAESEEGAGDGIEVLDITEIPGAVDILSEAADADWRGVNPTIFGTLFEGALDTGKRAQLGAHYTSEADIRLVIDPVLMSPLLSAWDATQAEAAPLMQTFLDPTTAPKARKTAESRLIELRDGMYAQLESTTVLDPACGSGNFLYVALKALKDLEGKIRDAFRPLAPDAFRDVVTPRQLFGIEKDPFAAKLAHVVMWIGYLQWRYEDEGVLHWHEPRKQPHPRALPNPIIQDKLKPTDPDRVTNDDAILRYDADGKPYEPAWPPAKIIIGNPPYMGSKDFKKKLGKEYTEHLHRLYSSDVKANVDLVVYWFEKCRRYIENNHQIRAGLVTTTTINQLQNREILQAITNTGQIFFAKTRIKWGSSEDTRRVDAQLLVSMIGFDGGIEQKLVLNTIPVPKINYDLTTGMNLRTALPIQQPCLASSGVKPYGEGFRIPVGEETTFIKALNPSGVKNSDVIRKYYNGSDIARRGKIRWIVDFHNLDDTSLDNVKKYKKPFEYIQTTMYSARQAESNPRLVQEWWLYEAPRAELREALKGLHRYLVTVYDSSQRYFVWLNSDILPDQKLIVFATDSDVIMGVLHSYIHELWSLRMAASRGVAGSPTYSVTEAFRTFPFPYSPKNEPAEPSAEMKAISAAAAALHAEREAWLNPPDLIKLGADEKALKDRTLTNLYNAVSAHREGNGRGGKIPDVARKFAPRMTELHDQLDAAVLSAYGWEDLTLTLRTPSGEEEVLRRLLAENLRRAEG